MAGSLVPVEGGALWLPVENLRETQRGFEGECPDMLADPLYGERGELEEHLKRPHALPGVPVARGPLAVWQRGGALHYRLAGDHWLLNVSILGANGAQRASRRRAFICRSGGPATVTVDVWPTSNNSSLSKGKFGATMLEKKAEKVYDLVHELDRRISTNQ